MSTKTFDVLYAGITRHDDHTAISITNDRDCLPADISIFRTFGGPDGITVGEVMLALFSLYGIDEYTVIEIQTDSSNTAPYASLKWADKD